MFCLLKTISNYFTNKHTQKSLTVEMLEKLGLKPDHFSKSKSFSDSTESSINSSISTSSSSAARPSSHSFMLWEIMLALVSCSNVKLAETSASNDRGADQLTLGLFIAVVSKLLKVCNLI